MSWQIQIYRAKPNPAGQDRVFGIPQHQQLLGEWVDLKNIGDQAVYLSSIHLAHTTYYSGGCNVKDKASIYWNGKGSDLLSSGQIVRIHTGKSAYYAYAPAQDKIGVHLHAFAEKGNFVLNNTCGDVLSVWYKGTEGDWHLDDEATYAPNLSNGQILIRSGSQLIPSYVSI